jgi:hypothetical protein
MNLSDLKAKLDGDIKSEQNTAGQEATVIHGSIHDVKLSAIIAELLGGEQPAELPDVRFDEVTVAMTPATRAFSLGGTAALNWDVGAGGGTIATMIALELRREIESSEGEGTPTATISCKLELSGEGRLAIVDELALTKVDIAFERSGGGEWSLAGMIGAAAFEREFELSAAYAAAGTTRTISLAIDFPNGGLNLIDLKDVGTLSAGGLAIEVARIAGESAELGGRAKTAWSVEGKGAISVNEVFSSDGSLSLKKQEDGTVGMYFEPENAEAHLPLPPKATLDLDFGAISFERLGEAPAGHGSRWAFTAAVATSIAGWPNRVYDVFPRTMTTTFRADAAGTKLTADRLFETPAFDLPDIAIPGVPPVSLGTARIDVSEFVIKLGDELDLSARLGVGLPKELNYIFGQHGDEPAMRFFRTYDPDNPDESLIAIRLGVGTAGITLAPLSSPIAAIESVMEGDLAYWNCDFGDFGAVKLQVPTLVYDELTSSFRASGSFELIGDLALPLTPIKQLLGACGLKSAEAAIPASLPLKPVNIVDEQGNFQVDELFRTLDAQLGDTLPDEIGDVLEAIGTAFERLPEDFRKYLHIEIPKNFFFEIAATAEGNLRFDARVYKEREDGVDIRKDYEPIKLLLPTMIGPVPGLNGISLWGISLGTLAGGSLFTLNVDADVDQFDLASLAASLLLPDSESSPLPAPTDLRRRLILDDLMMIVIYQTGIPIPVPLFYNQVGLEYLGLEGIAVQAHARFPMPQVSLSDIGRLVGGFKRFFADRDYLLQESDAPEHLTLKFTLADNYLRMPKYLGHDTLGMVGEGPTLDGFKQVAGLMNALKTLSFNDIIEVIPIEYRVGAGQAELGPFGAQADWLLSTPREFREIAGGQRSVPASLAQKVTGLLPAAGATLSRGGDEQGLLAYLGGNGSVGRLASFGANFGLAASGPMGFSSAFKLQGSIAGALDAELSGAIAINALKPGAALSAPAGGTPTYGLTLSGQGEYVDLGNPAALQIGGPIAITAWVKPAATDGLRDIVAHGYTNKPNGEVYFRVGIGRYQIGSWAGDDSVVSAAIPPEDIGRWVHLAGVYDGAAWHLYRDGAQIATAPASRGAIHVNAPWAIGAKGGGGERFFAGEIAEVSIWNRARTADEIRAGMGGLAGGEPGLVGYWRLDDATGATARDLSPSANHGALIGGRWQAPTADPARTALHVDGHSYLSILGRRVFEGQVQLGDDAFQIDGHLDLFPDESPLQVEGDLTGRMGRSQFYLAGDARAALAGMTLAQARATISNERVLVEGQWLGVKASLEAVRANGGLTMHGAAVVGFSMDVDFNQIGKAIGGQWIKLADTMRLSLAVSAAMDITVGAGGFSASVTASCTFNGKSRQVGPFTIGVAPSDVAALAAVVRQYVVSQGLAFFEQLYGDARTWVAAITSGTLVWTQGAYADTGRALKLAYGVAEGQAAQLLKSAGHGAQDVGRVMAQGYQLTAQQTTEVLRGVSYAAEDVGRTLQSAYGQTADQATQTMKQAGYTADEVGRTLRSVYNQTADDAARAMNRAGYAAEDVGRTLQSAYGQTADQAAQTMKNVGYSVGEVGRVLKNVFGKGTDEAARIFHKVGYGAQESATALRNGFNATSGQVGGYLKQTWGQSADGVNTALRGAGYAATEVDSFMRDTFGWGKEVAGKVVEGSKEAVEKAKDWFSNPFG